MIVTECVTMVKMLAVIACLSGIFAVLVIEEIFYQTKILEGEYLRKFVHMAAGSFIALWPWLISWGAIQLIGLAMFAVIWLNHRLKTLHASGEVGRKTYGFYLFALAVFVVPSLTHNKIFFALALLNMALADGMAAVLGTARGKKYEYRIFGQPKTIIGTMTFWFVSICILGPGLLFLHDSLSFSHYMILIIALPPALAALENMAVFGLDNFVVPVAAIFALQLAT